MPHTPDLTRYEVAVAREAGNRAAHLRSRPGLRQELGIIHTPPQIARYMAQAADRAVRDGLGLKGGLADPAVSIVDPACGTGVFGAACLAVAGQRKTAPCGFLGVDIDSEAVRASSRALTDGFLAHGWSARHVTANVLGWEQIPDEPAGATARVMIGNPPWGGRSKSRGLSLSDRWLADFRRDQHGQRLTERRLGVLSDDYVRFWRWCAEQARLAPRGGVVALVTNDSFLEGPLHRGMRGALLRWFDAIEVLSLGGGSLVGRRPGRDDNVFGVRPGAAVTLAWTGPRRVAPGETGLRHARLRGSKESKLSACHQSAIPQSPPTRPRPPFFFFAPQQESPPGYWDEWISISDLIPFHREGVQTNRDAALVDADPKRLRARVDAFLAGRRFDGDTPLWASRRHYDPDEVRVKVHDALDGAAVPIRKLAYRPYDTRYFVPIPPLCHRPRPELLLAVDASRWSLLTVRKDRGELPWCHAAASRHVPDSSYLSSRSSCRTRAFPSHLPDGSPNISERALLALGARLGETPTAHEAQVYALAILSAPSYARVSAGPLRVDYPRMPLPEPASWKELVRLGEGLRRVFLRKSGRGGATRIGHRDIRTAPASMARTREHIEARVAELLHIS